MPKMINYGGELIRINEEKKCLEYSTNDGRTWSQRFKSSNYGDFLDLLPYGNELLAVTSQGIHYSNNAGRSWGLRFRNSSNYGDFISLEDNGSEILATAEKGLYASKTGCRTWTKRN